MTILRQRMGCCRGGVRGRPVRHASLSSADTFTGSSSEIHPAPRRGQGRGRGKRVATSSSHHTHEHSASLQIPCMLSNHSFIATVTIQLSEGTAGMVWASPYAPPKLGDEDFPGSERDEDFPGQQCEITKNSAFQAQPTAAHSNPPNDGSPPKEKGLPSDEDDLSSFGCPIVEESPSNAHDA